MANIELLHVTDNPEKHIEFCGRTCYNSFDKITETSADGFVKGLINRNHLSVLEHAYASVVISGISRALTHQLVRHRLASYSQQSQRYVAISTSEKWFVIPPTIQNNKEAYLEYMNGMYYIANLYEKLLQFVPKEDARYILPEATKSVIVMSGNFRMWYEMFTKRLDRHAQWEIREMVSQIRNELEKKAPNVFDKKYFLEEE